MSTVSYMLSIFVVSFIFTVFCCYLGDDDVVYQVMGRKPSSQEGLARIRYVLAKTFASISGGSALAASIGLYLINEFSLHFSENEGVCVIIVCIFLTALAIGLVQNQIRRFQGRHQRPILDIAMLKYTLSQWF